VAQYPKGREAKYGGMDASLISEMKSLAEEHKRLKRMYAESQMHNDLLKKALQTSLPQAEPSASSMWHG
jgi:hypothetical protein